MSKPWVRDAQLKHQLQLLGFASTGRVKAGGQLGPEQTPGAKFIELKGWLTGPSWGQELWLRREEVPRTRPMVPGYFSPLSASLLPSPYRFGEGWKASSDGQTRQTFTLFFAALSRWSND